MFCTGRSGLSFATLEPVNLKFKFEEEELDEQLSQHRLKKTKWVPISSFLDSTKAKFKLSSKHTIAKPIERGYIHDG